LPNIGVDDKKGAGEASLLGGRQYLKGTSRMRIMRMRV